MRNVLILMLFFVSAARCGFERSDAGARARALGGAYTAFGRDVWSAFHNPAGLARLAGPAAGFFTAPRPFGLGELSYQAATAACPIPGGSCAVSASRYGFSLYREQTFAISLAFRAPGADVGVTLVRYDAAIERYGSASALGVHAGCVAALGEAFRVGFRIRNLNATAIGASDEMIRQSIAFGGAYQPHEAFALTAEMEKAGGRDPSLRTGAEYTPVPSVVVRFGLVDQPAEVRAGAGVRRGIVAVDYAFALHGELGPSHEWSVSLAWGGGGR